MFFISDNAGPTHPQIWDAMRRADTGHAMPYAQDETTAQAVAGLRALFEAPEASVHLVATGTAANVLALASLARPWDAIFCTPLAHIEVDECNAAEFFTGGAKLHLVPARGGKMRPEALERAIATTGGSVHHAARGPLCLTNLTECGTLYSPEELARLTGIARAAGLRSFLDGARFANACVAAAASPAEMSWRAGVDALSFGGTKNGLPGVEAVLFFNPEDGAEFERRRKRAGHLFSKSRYLAAQMVGALEGNLWRESARAANAHCARLAEALAAHPGVRLLYPAQGNMIFASAPRALHQALHDAGARYYLMDGPLEGDPGAELTARLVCDWSSGESVDAFLAALAGC